MESDLSSSHWTRDDPLCRTRRTIIPTLVISPVQNIFSRMDLDPARRSTLLDIHHWHRRQRKDGPVNFYLIMHSPYFKRYWSFSRSCFEALAIPVLRAKRRKNRFLSFSTSGVRMECADVVRSTSDEWQLNLPLVLTLWSCITG